MTEPVSVEQNQRGEVRTSDTSPALSTGGGIPGQGMPVVMVPAYPVAFRGRDGEGTMEQGEAETMTSLRARPGGWADMVETYGFHPEQDPISAEEMSPCLGAGAGAGAVAVGWQVRRLTPVERERLMGWPDGWTAWGIDDEGERVEMSDTVRERLTGNGVVSQCSEWIGRRIMAAEQ